MRQARDLTGLRVGHLTVVGPSEEKGKWKCLCDCGNVSTVFTSGLTSGQTKTCGHACVYSNSKAKGVDLTGQRFGRLVALHRSQEKPNGRTAWVCMCDCGTEKVIATDALRSGAVRSCGCLHRETASETGKKNQTTHGKSDTRLYRVWLAMRRRCHNPNNASFSHYGGRGIKVCAEWDSDYERFEEWAYANGYDENAPKGQYTIDRIDVNGNYCPENCRWATQKEQANNTRANHIVTYDGEEMTISQLADKVGIPYNKLQARITANGWSAEKAVSTPYRSKGSERDAG